MARLRYNGLTATLGAALTTSATSVTFAAALTHAAGSVPTIASPDYLPLTILDASGNVSEIVSLTAYTSGATMGTISRAQEGTTGVTHSSGDKVVHGPTTGDLAVAAKAATNPVKAIWDGSATDNSVPGSPSFLWEGGTTVLTSPGSIVTFDTPFPNGVVTVIVGNGDYVANSAAPATSAVTKTNFKVGDFSGTIRVNWLAIGW